ncbi:MAG: hypothetical protein NZ527_06230, partial [Hydrogenobacter thermophilus]|nr:hypothetical protein [Hydrogenobacter thermophilus]
MRNLVLALLLLIGIVKAQTAEDTITLLKVKPAVVLIYVYAKAQIKLGEKDYPTEIASTGSG